MGFHPWFPSQASQGSGGGGWGVTALSSPNGGEAWQMAEVCTLLTTWAEASQEGSESLVTQGGSGEGGACFFLGQCEVEMWRP